ncbi:unnamed protein product [Fraxinus pennsylvanica]|uniref:Uncharacterized protein n=1 Tax=Fraxinus pennsylvanica TaxID=56036 RepID=A0AAD1ZJJ7_9LAMI|nr:unnamed protein product [Fraxinus pennsylvanica]
MLASLLKLGKFTPVNTRQIYGVSDVPAENPRSSLNKLFSQKANRNGERSKLLEIKLEGMRKQFGAAVGMKTANQTKSCPNSSPTNENMFNARENSVQAAIAHCKKSFGQTDDFFFRVFCGLK